MRIMHISIAGALLGGAAAVTAQNMDNWSPSHGLAGVYTRSGANPNAQGPRYDGDDVIEVLPIDGNHAFVRVSIGGRGGEMCTLSGIARTEREELVYRAPIDPSSRADRPCTLSIQRREGYLDWTDNRTCREACADAAGLTDGRLAWSSRRKIRYTSRITGSPDYQGAMEEWRNRR